AAETTVTAKKVEKISAQRLRVVCIPSPPSVGIPDHYRPPADEQVLPPMSYRAASHGDARSRPALRPRGTALRARRAGAAGPTPYRLGRYLASVGPHLEREGERRQLLARVVDVVEHGQLQERGVGVRRRGSAGRYDLALVDGRVDGDEVRAYTARRLEEHGDVALAVEPAAVANVAVVDQDRVDVGGLRPADALQRDRDIAARLNDLGLDQRHAGGDHVYDGRLDVPRDGPDRVSAAQVVGCVEGEGEVAARG